MGSIHHLRHKHRFRRCVFHERLPPIVYSWQVSCNKNVSTTDAITQLRLRCELGSMDEHCTRIRMKQPCFSLSPSQTYVPPPDLGGPAPVTEEVTEQITMAPSEVPWAKPEPPLPAGNIARAKAVRAIGESGRYRQHPVEQLITELEAVGWNLGANMATKLRMMVRVLSGEQGGANILSGRNTPGNPSQQQEGESDALYRTRIMEGFAGAYRAF